MTTHVLTKRSVLLRCVSLQMLDLMTTLLFLAHGVAEANPLVKWSMSMTNSSLKGLIAVKCAACILALVAVESGRPWVVVKMNRFFVFLAVWNLFALGLSFCVR
jgi:hypothetical protein